MHQMFHCQHRHKLLTLQAHHLVEHQADTLPKRLPLEPLLLALDKPFPHHRKVLLLVGQDLLPQDHNMLLLQLPSGKQRHLLRMPLCLDNRRLARMLRLAIGPNLAQAVNKLVYLLKLQPQCPWLPPNILPAIARIFPRSIDQSTNFWAQT